MRLTLDKLEAARRQLETAVDLWFSDGDEVAIHTLAAAGGDLLRGVAIAAGRPVTLAPERFLEIIKPEHHTEVRRALRRSQNFFKHADRDSHETLEYETGEGDMRLLDACEAYRLMGTSPSPTLWAFETYAAFTWANHLLIDAVRGALPVDLSERIALLPRRDAFSELVEILS